MAEESKIVKQVEEKSKGVQFTDEEIESIKELQKKYLEIQSQFGQLSIMELRINKQLEAIDDGRKQLQSKFQEVQKEEQTFVEEITKKYGDGTLNPESGVFTQKN